MKIGIVGCGISGAYLAYKLSKKHDVTVFEAKKKIGKKACSGLVSERLWKFIPKNNKLIKNRVKNIIIHFPKKNIKLDLNPTMLVLDHDKLDRYVAKLGTAKIKLNTTVSKTYRKGEKQIIVAKGKNYEFDYVIGADGPHSVIRKSIGGKEPRHNLGIFVYEKTKRKSNVVDTWPTKGGFAWKIPRDGIVEYGIMAPPEIANREFKKFYKKNFKEKYSASIPDGLVLAHTDKVALIGDAAGLTKPWSGGGIIWSLQSANILLKNFPDFDNYNRELRKLFEPRIFFSRIISKVGVFFGTYLPWLVPKEIYFDSDWIF